MNQTNKEIKKKISESTKGRHKSDETRKKMSEAMMGHRGAATGKVWYNNGVEQRYFTEGEQPEGWIRGRIKWAR